MWQQRARIAAITLSVSACSLCVSRVKISMPSLCRRIASVITMSSADRLEARAAGACSSATRTNRCSSSEVLRFSVLVFAQCESVEAALLHEKQVIVQDIPDGAQLALEAIALAQKTRDRVATAVAELGEVHRDEREALHASGERFRPLVGIEPYAQRPRFRARKESIAAL